MTTKAENAFTPEVAIAALQVLLEDQFNLSGRLRSEYTVVDVLERIWPTGPQSEMIAPLRQAIALVFDVPLDVISWNELSSASPLPVVRYVPGGNITVGQLSDWLSRNTRQRRLAPDSGVSGDASRAIVLEGLRRVAQSVWPSHKPVDMDTLLEDRFNSRELSDFWTRVRCLSIGRVPKSTTEYSFLAEAGRGLHYLLMFPMSCLLTGLVAQLGVRAAPSLLNVHSGHFLLFPILVLFVFILLVVVLLKTVRLIASRYAGPRVMLPDGITTFGDCVLFITGERRGQCKACGYNLTGVVSPVCPECGTRWQDPENRPA